MENGCCTRCMAAVDEAGDLIVFDDASGHCHVARQPQSPQETGKMVRAAYSAELQCLRYKGQDHALLVRLAEAGLKEICDNPTPAVAPLWRNEVTFSRSGSLRDLAHDLVVALGKGSLRVSSRWRWRSRRIDILWANTHRAYIVLAGTEAGWRATVHKVNGAGAGLTISLADALEAVGATDARWHSDPSRAPAAETAWPL